MSHVTILSWIAIGVIFIAICAKKFVKKTPNSSSFSVVAERRAKLLNSSEESVLRNTRGLQKIRFSSLWF